jgi:hypothetical protein
MFMPDNFYVPPIIFNLVELPDSQAEDEQRFKRVCVDGKQRLSSVRMFMEGIIPMYDAHGIKW